MSRTDRNWRPSDADRERYAGAVSQAFAEGRIDAADMESRTALIYEAKTIADLDALVEDMPAPAAAPAAPATGGRGGWIRLAFGAVALAVLLGVLLLTFRDGPTPADPPAREPVPVEEPPAEPPEPPAPPAAEVDLPAIDMEQFGLFTLAGLQELWAAAADTEPSAITLFADNATLEVRSSSPQRALDRVEYSGGLLLLPGDPYRDLGDGEPDDEVFFSWSDVTPEAVMAAIDGMPAATGLPDVTVGHISIGHYQDGLVTISVYPEGDTGVTYVRWDPTGQEVIRVY
ncbi:DUF1707 SHOCT-like domain-containing protein [Jiangella anatolica]|uniref:DUF1707 SHOCT-like domain-containing protein n=1 Tax=Jiangella anatolica TaxID=2670374 RepID=UPI0013140CB6|nr:DUF1707 domain-containing protein [Jiangella anatolica]